MRIYEWNIKTHESKLLEIQGASAKYLPDGWIIVEGLNCFIYDQGSVKVIVTEKALVWTCDQYFIVCFKNMVYKLKEDVEALA